MSAKENNIPKVRKPRRRQTKSSLKIATIHTPQGWQKGDPLVVALVEHDGYEGAGILRGDVIVTYLTADVQLGDVATVRELKTDTHFTGYYRPRPGGYIELETSLETHIFKPGEGEAIGRAVGVIRDGEYVLTAYSFRGIYHADSQQSASRDDAIKKLRHKLERLDFEPQNEACRFKLETEIYNLENYCDEWPELINA